MKVPERKEGPVRCPLCGHRFSLDEGTRCSGCLYRRRCNVISCPRCGYGFVERSGLVDLIDKWLKRRKKDETSLPKMP